MAEDVPEPRTDAPETAARPGHTTEPVPDRAGPLPGRIGRLVARSRARFRERIPPGWNWRRVVVGLVLGEVAAGLILLIFLAVSGKALVISFERPAVELPTGPSPRLTIPVAGVLATELEENFGAPRTPTRTHLGIDIRAPIGTPVVAAAAGTIVRLDSNSAGGTTIHQRSLDGRTVFYYAHLQRRAAGLAPGHLVRQGDTIAFVGESGNARGIPHLHFAVYEVSHPNEVSDGRHLDPYPLLVDSPER